MRTRGRTTRGTPLTTTSSRTAHASSPSPRRREPTASLSAADAIEDSVYNFVDVIKQLRMENQELRRTLATERVENANQSSSCSNCLLLVLLGVTALMLAGSVLHESCLPWPAVDPCSEQTCLHGGYCIQVRHRQRQGEKRDLQM